MPHHDKTSLITTPFIPLVDFNTAHNALIQADGKNIGVKLDEVTVIAPCFMTQLDADAGSISEDSLIFGLTTWASGHYNEGPSGVSKVSAYQVLDELVAHYMDRSAYPNLNTVVIAGHSLGAQMVQRYAAMRNNQDTDDRLHYWVGECLCAYIGIFSYAFVFANNAFQLTLAPYSGSSKIVPHPLPTVRIAMTCSSMVLPVTSPDTLWVKPTALVVMVSSLATTAALCTTPGDW